MSKDTCVCGGSTDNPNDDCERCQLIAENKRLEYLYNKACSDTIQEHDNNKRLKDALADIADIDCGVLSPEDTASELKACVVMAKKAVKA